MPSEAPDIGQTARHVAGAMIAGEEPDGLAWANAKRPDGSHLYTVAVVMGSENCRKMDKLFTTLAPHMAPVDIFPG